MMNIADLNNENQSSEISSAKLSVLWRVPRGAGRALRSNLLWRGAIKGFPLQSLTQSSVHS